MAAYLPLTASTVALYRFGEAGASATSADSSGNGYTLTVTGGSLPTTQGLSGRARQTEGIGTTRLQQASHTAALLSIFMGSNTSLTVETVFYPRSTNNGYTSIPATQMAVAYGTTNGGSSASNTCYLYYKSDGTIGWGWQYNSNASSNAYKETAAATLTTDAWHYLVGVRDWTGSQYNLYIYLDGVLVDSLLNATGPSGGGATCLLGVGCWPNYGASYNSMADFGQVRIQSTAMSAADIAAMSPMVLANSPTEALRGNHFNKGFD